MFICVFEIEFEYLWPPHVYYGMVIRHTRVVRWVTRFKCQWTIGPCSVCSSLPQYWYLNWILQQFQLSFSPVSTKITSNMAIVKHLSMIGIKNIHSQEFSESSSCVKSECPIYNPQQIIQKSFLTRWKHIF